MTYVINFVHYLGANQSKNTSLTLYRFKPTPYNYQSVGADTSHYITFVYTI